MGLGRGSLPSRQSAIGSVGEPGLIRLDIDDFGVAGSVGLVGSLVSEDVDALDKSSLGVLAAINEVGVIESKLNCTVYDVICSLNAKHKAVILVPC
jgi:hypothetical protein